MWSMVLQRNRSTLCTIYSKGDLLWGISHKITGTEKSHNLPSASWWPKKASGINSVGVLNPENLGINDVNPSVRAGEDEIRCPSSTTEAGKKGGFLFFHILLYSGSQHIG